MSRISVIVPVFNCEKYLGEAIESIRNQSLQDIEVLLIDDGSSDGSGLICDEIAVLDHRFKVWHMKNSGVSHARNTGIEYATGDYVTFVDADDAIAPQMLEQFLEDADSSGAELIIGGSFFEYFTQHGVMKTQEVMSAGWTGHFKREELSHYFQALCNCRCIEPVWGKLISRELLLRENIRFDERLSAYEDYMFSLDCLTSVTSVFVQERPLYHHHRRREPSLSKSYRANMGEQLEIVAIATVSFYENVLGKNDDALVHRHLFQFISVALNNAVRGRRKGHDLRREIEEICEKQVFAEAICRATVFPNRYSQVQRLMARARMWQLVIAVAHIRNLIRRAG